MQKGEIIGTGIIGAIVSYPVMTWLWGKEGLSWLFYVPSFICGTLIGGSIAYVFLRKFAANDLLYANGEAVWFAGVRIHNPNTHGTGCTLSSAIAANLAKGFPLTESVQSAKDYVSGALGAMLDLGHGSGPLDHAFALHGNRSAKESSTAK